MKKPRKLALPEDTPPEEFHPIRCSVVHREEVPGRRDIIKGCVKHKTDHVGLFMNVTMDFDRKPAALEKLKKVQEWVNKTVDWLEQECKL